MLKGRGVTECDGYIAADVNRCGRDEVYTERDGYIAADVNRCFRDEV